MIRSAFRARLGLCTSVLALLATVPASAQIVTGAPESDADTAQAESPADEEIIVTGSRIARPELEVAVPVVAVTSEAIEATGLNNVTDVLIRNPALTASTGGSLSGRADSGLNETGANFLNLRNLGEDRTLVLVDGRRHVAGIPNSAAVDINSIPQDLIQKVDVLTGGASAIYGADGVSGVVNFVLRRDFEGVTARAQAGISDDGDAGTQLLSVVAGTNFAGGRGNITAAYEYSNSDRLTSFDRPYTGDNSRYRSIWQNIDDFRPTGPGGALVDDPNVFDNIPYTNLTWFESAPNGAVDLDLDFVADRTGDNQPYDAGTFLPGGSGRAIGGSSNTPTAGYFGDLFPQIEKHAANLLTRFEFSPAFNVFAEGKFVRTKSFSVGQPAYDFFTYLQPDNAFLLDRFGAGAAPDGAYVTRDHFDFGQRGENITRETLRFVGGFDGDLTEDARYEISYVFGQTESRSTQTSNLIGDRYYAAIDAVRAPNGQIVCRSTLDPTSLENDPNYGAAPTTFTPGSGSPCVPLNILGNNVNPAALAFALFDNDSRGTIRQHVVSGSLSGDFDRFLTLPGGSIGFALGAEYRKEESSSIPDPLVQSGDLRDFSAVAPSSGEFDVKEVFAELNVPILADIPFAEILSASAAVRLSDYSTVGSTSSWKVDAIYAPIEDIRFRGSYAQAVRAPNIGELFLPSSGTFLFVTDPCDVTRVNQGTSFRQANCATILGGLGLTPAQIAAFNPSGSPTGTTSRRGTVTGNPDLSEETARTWTAGVILRPRFIPGLTVTFDWYNIRIRDAINTPTATELAELCVDQPTIDNVYCANVFRNAAPGASQGFVLGDGNDPQRRIGFNVSPANVAAFRTAGADFGISYNFEPGGDIGRFNLNLVGGYLDTVTFVPTPGAEVDDDTLESYNPRWRGSANVSWTLDDFSLNYGVVYWSKTRRYTTEQREADPDISDPRYFFYNERWEHDIRAELRVDDRFSFYGGVNNIFEQEPDLGQLSYPVSGIGRFFYAGAKVTLPSF